MSIVLLERHIESINERFDKLEWQLELLVDAIEDISAKITVAERNTAIKASLEARPKHSPTN